MEAVLRLIYDRTINNKILNLKDIEKIIELLVINKQLNNYIINMNTQLIRSNKLASYSINTKSITIYIRTIEEMVKNIENNIVNIDNFEIFLYKNLSILQVILHEVEHANQQKIAYSENSLEAFIIRLSYQVNDKYNELLYEYNPEERLAEIKSFEQLIALINYISKKMIAIPEILETEKKLRMLGGYHYKKSTINIPLVDYFTFGKWKEFLKCFDFSSETLKKYTLNKRLKYGFPISIDEYSIYMKSSIISLKKNFNNRIKIK